MRVLKWGDSLAVRLPAAIVEALDLRPGDEIDIQVAGDRQFAVNRASAREDLLARIHAFRGRLPADFTFGRDELNGR